MSEKRVVKHDIFWIAVTIMFASFCIFNSYAWGKYILLLCAAFVFAFGYVLKYRFDDIYIRPFHVMTLLFTAYCYLSAIWAWDANTVFVKSFTVLQIVLCFSLLYCYYEKQQSIGALFDSVRWGGYIVAVYSIFSYGGIGGIMSAISSGVRLENEYNNVNTIAMVCAIACVLEFYNLLYNGIGFSAVFMIPCILMMAATQSRKAIIMFVLGVVAIAVLKNFDRKRFVKSVMKISVLLIIIAIVIGILLSMDMFAGLRDRMLGLVGESSEADYSAKERAFFVELGLEQFLKTPFLGIGIDCSKFLTADSGHMSTYLHNNFIELLACGGIVGFILYYSIHAYLLYNLLKYYKYDKPRNLVCITMLLIMIVIDYGMVSYFDKSSYFYYMIFFLQVENLKKSRHLKEKNLV